MKVSNVYNLVANRFQLKLNNEEKKIYGFTTSTFKTCKSLYRFRKRIWWLFKKTFCKDKNYQIELQKNNLMLKEIGLNLKKCKWSLENIKNCLDQYILKKSLTFKDIGPILRMALTGKLLLPI